MFATLLGGLPRPLDEGGSVVGDDDRAVEIVLAAQVQAGLEPLTDGRLRAPAFGAPIARLAGVTMSPDGPRLAATPTWVRPLTVEGWRFAAGHAPGLVKAALPGPYSLSRRLESVDHTRPADRDALAAALATAIRQEIEALGEAGCAFVEIEEPDARFIGSDSAERRRFADAHHALLDGVTGIHVSLAITGGSADAAGPGTLLAPPYRSFAFDLIDGPDNWRLIRDVPGDRGVICGAMPAERGDEGPEVLLWASAYAASSHARGRDRVGLATSGGLGRLTWPEAVEKMQRLGEASRLAAGPRVEAMSRIDPRAVDLRSAALGRYLGPAERPRRRRKESPS